MIPEVIQRSPTIKKRFYCANCGSKLADEKDDQLNYEGKWSFCPFCGETIEWEKAKHPVWKAKNCAECGTPILRDLNGMVVPTGAFVGTDLCIKCMIAHCYDTACSECGVGNFPDCQYKWIKDMAMTVGGCADEKR